VFADCPDRGTTAAVGGYLPLAPGVSTVRYPIPQRTFKYVATVQVVTDEMCHKLTPAEVILQAKRSVVALIDGTQ
jgi:hypothetical protein